MVWTTPPLNKASWRDGSVDRFTTAFSANSTAFPVCSSAASALPVPPVLAATDLPMLLLLPFPDPSRRMGTGYLVDGRDSFCTTLFNSGKPALATATRDD